MLNLNQYFSPVRIQQCPSSLQYDPSLRLYCPVVPQQTAPVRVIGASLYSHIQSQKKLFSQQTASVQVVGAPAPAPAVHTGPCLRQPDASSHFAAQIAQYPPQTFGADLRQAAPTRAPGLDYLKVWPILPAPSFHPSYTMQMDCAGLEASRNLASSEQSLVCSPFSISPSNQECHLGGRVDCPVLPQQPSDEGSPDHGHSLIRFDPDLYANNSEGQQNVHEFAAQVPTQFAAPLPGEFPQFSPGYFGSALPQGTTGQAPDLDPAQFGPGLLQEHAHQINNFDENQNFLLLTPPKLSMYPMQESSGDSLNCASDEGKSSAALNSSSQISGINEVKRSKKRRSPAAEAKQLERLFAFQEKLVTEKGLPKSRLQTARELGMTPIPTSQMTPIPTSQMTPIPTSQMTPIPTSQMTPIPTSLATPIPTSQMTPIPTSLATPIPTSPPREPAITPISPEPTQEVKMPLVSPFRPNCTLSMDSDGLEDCPRNLTGSANQDTSGARGPQVCGNLQTPVARFRGYDNRLKATETGFCWGCRKYGYISQIGNNVFCWFCRMYGYIVFMPVTVIAH